MEKVQFTYQRWSLRLLGFGLIIPIVFWLQYLIAKIMGLQYANTMYIIICTIVAFFTLFFYYKLTQRYNCFLKKGSYWVDNGTVYVATKRNTYKIQNAKLLRGTTVSVYGMAKSGMLIAEFNRKKLILTSDSDSSIKKFSDCELFPLLETILMYNPNLEKHDVLKFWYEAVK